MLTSAQFTQELAATLAVGLPLSLALPGLDERLDLTRQQVLLDDLARLLERVDERILTRWKEVVSGNFCQLTEHQRAHLSVGQPGVRDLVIVAGGGENRVDASPKVELNTALA